MDPMFETKKRLKIAKDITSQLKRVVKGILLGGSMGYGQNYSVTSESDIDLVVVVDINKLNELNKTNYFQNQTPQRVLDMFKRKEINVFWVTKNIDDMKINVFVYETQNYVDFCLLERNLTVHVKNKPSDMKVQFGFDGKPRGFYRNVRPTENGTGWLYERSNFINGKFILIPPTCDFIESCKILCDQDNFLGSLQDAVWERVIEQLVKEHGPEIDLDEFSVLNSHWVYKTRPEKFPLEVSKRIREKTKKYLERINE